MTLAGRWKSAATGVTAVIYGKTEARHSKRGARVNKNHHLPQFLELFLLWTGLGWACRSVESSCLWAFCWQFAGQSLLRLVVSQEPSGSQLATLDHENMLNHPFKKVLIVDDSPMMLHLLDRVLSAGGYEVHQARNGFEALDKMQDECCDFVITDWHMPTMDGIELCRQLRSMSWPQYVYIAVLTSSDSSDDLVVALDAGADDFYIKPVVAPELLARMRAGTRFLSLERQLRIQARLDPLTEVLNRRTFEEVFSREWNFAERHGTQLSCVMMDVDF